MLVSAVKGIHAASDWGKYRSDRKVKTKTIEIKYVQFRKQNATNQAISKSVGPCLNQEPKLYS